MAELKASNNTVTSVKDRELIVTRQLQAPRELVFKAWTDHHADAFQVGAEELNKVVNEYGAIEGAKSTLQRLEEHLAKL